MVRDFPPAICAQYLATHLANAGAMPGLGDWARLNLADQALRHMYAGGWRLVRAKVLDDMGRERDELLAELSAVTAQRDRLLEQQVASVVDGDAPWPLERAVPVSREVAEETEALRRTLPPPLGGLGDRLAHTSQEDPRI